MDNLGFKILRTKKLTFGQGTLEVIIRVFTGYSDYVLNMEHLSQTVSTLDEVAEFVRYHPTNSIPSEVKITVRDTADRLRRSIGLRPISLIVVDLKTEKPVLNFCINPTAAAGTNNHCAKDILVKAITGKRATQTLSYTGYKLVPGLQDTEFAEVTVGINDSEAFINEFDFVSTRNINGSKFAAYVNDWLY